MPKCEHFLKLQNVCLPGCSILDMNPPSRILWGAGKVTGVLPLLFFGPTFLCLQTPAFLTPGALFIGSYVLKSYLIISLWVSSHYKMYLCLIIFNWRLFLLKSPSLSLHLVCLLGNVRDFSFKWQFCNSCDCPWVSPQSLPAEHEIVLLSETWWLPQERILDCIALTYLFLH